MFSETVVLFVSDNGGQEMYSSETDYEGKHGPYPRLGDNRPLRGWKQDLYESGILAPAFVYWRGRLKPSRPLVPVSYLDWFPTPSRGNWNSAAIWNVNLMDLLLLLRV